MLTQSPKRKSDGIYWCSILKLTHYLYLNSFFFTSWTLLLIQIFGSCLLIYFESKNFGYMVFLEMLNGEIIIWLILNYDFEQNVWERCTVKCPINISTFFFRLIDILATWTIRLNLNYTFTLAILRLLLVPIGSRFCFSQSILGQWPKVPIKNFSLIMAKPTGVYINLAWVRPYKFLLNIIFTRPRAFWGNAHFQNPPRQGFPRRGQN